MNIRTALSYDDVLLVPQYSEVTKDSVDLSSYLVNMGTAANCFNEFSSMEDYKFKYPIITSPMDTVTEIDMAIKMATLGGLGIVHRYNTIERQLQILRDIFRETGPSKVGFAVGVSGDSNDRVDMLIESGARIICVDVAHGHYKGVGDFIKALSKRINRDKVHIMAGNVATAEGALFLQEAGAHSIRAGIGSGGICSTRIKCAHGVPVFQSLMDIKSHKDFTITLIADGGIKNSGDMAKALACGADFVMVGSLFAGTTETPNPIVSMNDGKKYKEYRGMASREAQEAYRGSYSSNEGISTFIPYKGDVDPIFNDVINNVKRALCYSGAKSIGEFQNKAQFVIQTGNGQLETSTHILSRS